VLFFGTYDARRYPRVRVLQEGFTALGDEVLECNVPLRLDTAARVKMLRRPWLVPLLAAKLASSWIRLIQTVYADRIVRCRTAESIPPHGIRHVGVRSRIDQHFSARVTQREMQRVGVAVSC